MKLEFLQSMLVIMVSASRWTDERILSNFYVGHIMIYGPDSQSVQRAREQLELQEESFPLNVGQMDWMSDKLNASVVCKSICSYSSSSINLTCLFS